MKSWLSQVFSSKDFWINFSVAVIFLLTGKLSTTFIRIARQIWQSNRLYSVSGFWIGHCVLPSVGSSYLVEIWRIVQRKDQIKLTLFVYSPNDKYIDKHIGSGVFRGSYLSAIYYSVRRDSYESGVIALKLARKKLSGTYAQFDIGSSDERFYASDGEYSITRVDLPLKKAMKMWLGFPPFQSFSEANAAFEQHCTKPVALIGME